MRTSICRLLPLVLAATGLAISACSEQPQQKQSQPNPPQSNANASSSGTKTQAVGTITANPNPIQVCDRSGAGVAVLSWTSTGATTVEVHVGKPDGDLLARSAPNGNATTGKWVRNGMVFYLQDASKGRPIASENTIATVTVSITDAGCR
jgi:hypothetical protein